MDLPGAYIRDLVELVARWKVTPHALLAGLPIAFGALADPTTRVPIRVCEAIVARAIELTGEPALAFHVGVQMRLSSHGFLGFAAMTASTVREALDLATRFAATRTSAIGLVLHVEGATASLVIEERTELGRMRDFVVLALIVGIWQLGQALTGRTLDGIAECAFAEPAYAKAFADAKKLRFDRPSHRLVFAASILDLPVTSADVVATRLAIEQCERELAAATETGLPIAIRAAITDGKSLAQVARVARLSTRTLKRRLADHGTTFTVLRDDARRQRALLLLDDRTITISEIATRLGYTELPNFTRAFRKWTGMTPLAYRARR